VLVLGIESTCDETGVALVEDGRRIVTQRVLSQVPIHQRFGGVVPELASRAHVENVTQLLDQVLTETGLDPAAPAIDLIAVANRPGLIGSLLVGLTAAKSLALSWNVPLVGVDHVHAHIYSTSLRSPETEETGTETGTGTGPQLPAVSLVVSGGHTALYLSKSWTEHQLLGSTNDDAVGEAFDKVAAILGLGYPGGPAISRIASAGNSKSTRFPRTLLGADSLDFSFSGIKTAVLYRAKGQNAPRSGPLTPGVQVADVAAAFEEAVVDVLITKLRRAIRRQDVRCALVAGGVAANNRLRSRLAELAEQEQLDVFYPPLELCTDNAAMIAGLGYHRFQNGTRHDLSLDAYPMMERS
jgi:N6-L-threonylcarbamoyladenine synthase